MTARPRPWGVFLIALFFAAATVVLVGVGLALLAPDSALEIVWRAYPARRAILMPYREWLAPAFLVLAVAMAAASLGSFRQRRWGRHLSVTIFAVNGLGDAGQIAFGHWLEGGIGVLAAAAILFYLTRPVVRNAYV